MNTHGNDKYRLLAPLALAAAILSSPSSNAQIVTNWVAYNDHRPNYTPVNGWVTAPRVTTYDMGAPNDTPPSPLTNFLTGEQLSVMMAATRTGTPDDFGEAVRPNDNTPSANLFKGIVDVGNTGLVGVRYSSDSYVTLTFSGLDPSRHYVFRGTSTRGGGYALRWAVATIIGAQTYVDAHINGTVRPVLTANDFPADLESGQAAWNSGDNLDGAVIGWDFITPAADGTFSIQSSNYVGQVPGGLMADNTRYGYAIDAFLLAEVELAAPEIAANPPAQTTLEENRSFSLRVTATGTPLFYQWYKDGGAIAGATFATYSVAQASQSDSGDYYVEVSNPLGTVTSTTAHVTVNPDSGPPSVATAFCYPSFDPLTQLASMNQVIVEFSEPVEPSSATDSFRYQVSGGGGIASISLTNNQTVVLTLGSALAEDTDYTVQVSDVFDLVGNNISNGGTNNPASFHTWVQGPGNGLVYEAYNSGPGVTVDILTNSPVFPDNPFLRTNVWIFDTRSVFSDDSQGEYGSRTRGVFIPPVSGDWVFFLRCFDRGEFYLSPVGLDPAGKQLLLAEVTGNNPRDWDKFISAPVTLQAGQAYYIEGLQQADVLTDPDVLKVAARLSGTGFPPVGIPDLTLDTNALLGAAVGYPFAPRDLGGPLTIVQQPVDIAAEDQHIATFSVRVTNPSGLPVSYQWFRDGIEIPGASGPDYSFRATLGDSGATFSVRAAKLGSVVTSDTVNLSVEPDVTPPTVVAVHVLYPMNRVMVSYSEPVLSGLVEGSAEDLFSYGTDGSFAVTGAVLDSTETNVTLTFDLPLAASSTHPLTVSFVRDLSGHEIAFTDLTLEAWVPSRGFALEELFLNIGAGTLVSDLTSSPTYPDSPDVVTWVPTLEGPINADDNYGTQLTGWIVPPAGGDYLFYVCSDDASEFHLSANDDPAAVQLIAQETSYNPLRTWTGDRAGGTRGTPPSNISTNPIPMTAGQMYAFMALSKEGGGDDNLGVTWQVPGQPVPADGTLGIAGAHLYALADPVGASVTITQQPADFEAGALPGTATFTVAAESTLRGVANTNMTYLWQRDDGAGFNDILGAYSSTYSVTIAQADVGARFRALVFSPGASATSDVATAGGSSMPRISIARQGNVVRVSWPLPGTGITLQQAPSLDGIPQWTAVPSNTYQTDATSVYVEVVLPAANAFYRLSQ